MRRTLGTMTLGTMRSTMDNHEDRKEAPNLGKHKINEAPKLSSDDKEEMISSYQEMEKTLKCSKYSHKIIIKTKKQKTNPWLK